MRVKVVMVSLAIAVVAIRYGNQRATVAVEHEENVYGVYC